MHRIKSNTRKYNSIVMHSYFVFVSRESPETLGDIWRVEIELWQGGLSSRRYTQVVSLLRRDSLTDIHSNPASLFVAVYNPLLQAIALASDRGGRASIAYVNGKIPQRYTDVDV